MSDSERVQAEWQQLLNRIQELQDALNNVGAYVFTKDINGRYTFVNRMVCELFNRTPDQIIGKTDEAFFDLAISNDLRQNDIHVMENNVKVESEEVNYIAATRERRVYWAVKIPLHNSTGEVSGLCGISTDITERRNLEQQTHEQKILLDSILNHADAYIYMKDRHFRYRYVNSKLTELFGASQAHILGKQDADFMPLEEARKLNAMDRRVLRLQRKQCGEETITHPNGEKRHYWSIKVPLFKENQVDSLIGISTDITEIVQLRKQFEELANTDALTGIFSRRHWMERAEYEFKRARRTGHAVAVILFDIDRFKHLNDAYGHLTGDRAIQMLVSVCKNILREIDLFGRWGGDEFVAMIGNARCEEVLLPVERLRDAIARTPIMSDEGEPIYITSSFGVVLSHQHDTLADLFSSADTALYRAKCEGRNRVCLFKPDGVGGGSSRADAIVK
ncbi:diguanylate cyclase [Nitrosomonas sp.]|uniref:sensor domain-containing diguanylate cyclase n=1 Tax=Nitrosomonas sp. TaxID=42353 RepID=UPI002639B822|nr:diguanylate cyclase [Nitrosomonas sp.]MCW5600398.1 diguanylate cyclase [Nitrosomonas sp.]